MKKKTSQKPKREATASMIHSTFQVLEQRGARGICAHDFAQDFPLGDCILELAKSHVILVTDADGEIRYVLKVEPKAEEPSQEAEVNEPAEVAEEQAEVEDGAQA